MSTAAICNSRGLAHLLNGDPAWLPGIREIEIAYPGIYITSPSSQSNSRALICTKIAYIKTTTTTIREYRAVLDGFPVGVLRSVSGKEAIKAFIKAGGTVRYGKGDNINVKMPNGQQITIPVSGDLKIG